MLHKLKNMEVNVGQQAKQQTRRRIKRGEIRVNGAAYFSPELMPYEGQVAVFADPGDRHPQELCVQVGSQPVLIQRDHALPQNSAMSGLACRNLEHRG
jgi:hypothetical protein